VDLRILGHGHAFLDLAEDRECLPVEPFRINALREGQICGEFLQALAELADGALAIAALAVVEPDGKVNEGLQEEPPRPGLRRPSLFQDFVTPEKLAIVEELDSPPQ